MESPFASTTNSSIILYLEPVLNTYYKTYQNIITVSAMPAGPLADLVSPISMTKLSPFQELGTGIRSGNNCTHVLLRYPKSNGGFNMKNSDCFMGVDDIPSVFSYLGTNGYTIDTNLTKMMNQSRVMMGGVSDTRFSGDRKMICIISKMT